MNNFVRYNLNIAGIENYVHIQDSIPQCWSEPVMGNVLRKDLKPPIVQQAAFDNIVSKFEIYREVEHSMFFLCFVLIVFRFVLPDNLTLPLKCINISHCVRKKKVLANA